MPRVAIVDYLRSAGGVERHLRGLAEGLLHVPESKGWEFTLLLSSIDTSHRRAVWPAALTGPHLEVEYLGESNILARILNPLAHAQGISGAQWTCVPGFVASRLARRLGPMRWRAMLGDPYSQISLLSKRFDLVYLPYPFAMRAPPLGPPVVTTPADFNFKHFLSERSHQRRVQERALRSWLDRSDRLLFTSHAMVNELRTFYPEYESKADVVHLGVTVGSRPPSDDELCDVQRRHGLPTRFVLVSGWVMPHKNQLLAIEALTLLRRRGVTIPLVFAGPNTSHLITPPGAGFEAGYALRVREAMDNQGWRLGRDYFALGYVTDTDIQALYRLATVFVQPTLYEGFGLPGLEAMLAGCPTLLSSIPPFEEQKTMLNGAVRTFDPRDANALADALHWAVTDRPAALELTSRAAAGIPIAYDWKKTARLYLAVFEDVIRRTRDQREEVP